MKAYNSSSLFRRLLLAFSGVILSVALTGMAYVLFEAKATQRVRTASENAAHTHEIVLHLAAIGRQPAKLVSAAETLERIRTQMFRELDYHSRVRLRIWQDNALVYNSIPQLPDALPAPETAEARSANAWVRSIVRDDAAGLVVERSHEVDDEWMLTFSGVSFLMSSTIFSLPLLLLPAWLIVGIGLRPLRSIANEIEQRDVFDLTALPDSKYRELSPLVVAINRLMAHLSQRIAREHEFITDAAHELKTPLAAIQINAHVLLSRCGPDVTLRCADAVEGLRDGVSRASHMVHQLLALERANTHAPSEPWSDITLDAFIRERMALLAPMAVQRDVDIAFHAAAPWPISAHLESLAALLDNLISNAIKYSCAGDRVDVTLAANDGRARLTVSDQGPGIDPALHKKVFERFFRIPGQEQAGSGLGLAIAERAATRNGAAIALANGIKGKGLTVTVDFATPATTD